MQNIIKNKIKLDMQTFGQIKGRIDFCATLSNDKGKILP